MNKLVRIRRVFQLFFLVLFVFILWSTTYPLTGVIPAQTFFKTDPLLMAMTALGERTWLPGLTAALLMLGLALLAGRFFCGWICPLGTLMDVAARLMRRSGWGWSVATRRLRIAKFGLLAAVLVTALAGIQTAWVLDPMVITGRFVSLNLIPAATRGLDAAFVFLMTSLQMRETLIDVYHWLQGTLLGIPARFFSHSIFVFGTTFVVLGTVVLASRFWCRCVCPLGALYAFFARAARVRRYVDVCKHCTLCVSRCRMGAIRPDMSYDKGECILCMDCVYDCPQHMTRFGIRARVRQPVAPAGSGLSRRGFLALLALSLFAAGRRAFAARGRWTGVIRPPAALPEAAFLGRCVRCGNCMKVCPTGFLQPLVLEQGPENLWTPHAVPEVGYCEYLCVLCGEVCPTGAIRRLTVEQKRRTRLGLAAVDRTICLPWASGQECRVCEEHCPVPEKAIKVDLRPGAAGRLIGAPLVDQNMCIGCGICQNKCPVRPERAIRVYPLPE
ncbi:MAG: 4Fe-4S binding protein [Deltaproteobacteria bacterium]